VIRIGFTSNVISRDLLKTIVGILMTRSSKDIRLPLIESSLHSESPSLSAEKTQDPFLVGGGVAKAPARRMSSIRFEGRKGSEWPSAGGDGRGAGNRWYDMLVERSS
jgi:hypothetical protein